MANPPQQLDFFPSLDFQGRTVLYMQEIAEKIGVTRQQVSNLADTGELGWLNVAANLDTRPCKRIPIEHYRNFIVRRMNGEMRMEFLGALPVMTLIELKTEIDRLLKGGPHKKSNF